ncbi:MYCBP-associated protein [Exaiptasia diaphana]|uniref:MYCBP-associated protein n=1 Tax=Exaiptasia diaphana TaxID=2652724 RepID=A0A913XBJ4_EXADI|nr:MYCBP-associated protein [Exaiptasia diaphana]KXJ26552.1 MYCBP-associated protein [Exaiptasia diaphana]
MSNKLSSKPSKRDRPKSTDKSKGKKQNAGTPEKVGSPVPSTMAVIQPDENSTCSGKVISGGDIESLAINQEELKKVRAPRKPDIPKPSTRIMVRKTRVKTPPDDTDHGGKRVTVARPAPPDAPLVVTPLTGSTGPSFDSEGQVLSHTILGSWDDFYQEAINRGDIENLPPFSGSFVHAKEIRPHTKPEKKTKVTYPVHVYQTKVDESKALLNYQKQMMNRKQQQKHLSDSLQVTTDMLIMNQSDDYRTIQEQRHVIDRAIPSLDYGKGYRVGSEFWKQVQQVGNDETGIMSTLTQTEQGYPPPIEHIGKPIYVKNEMGIEWSNTRCKSAVHYPWHESRFLQERTEQLAHVMNEIDPHQPYIDNLEVIGTNKPVIASKHSMSTVPEEEEPESQLQEQGDPLRSYSDVLPRPILGPSLTIDGQTAQWTGATNNGLGRVGVSCRVLFEAHTNERCVSLLNICNDGTTAIYYSWKMIPKANKLGTRLAGSVQRFYFDTNSGVILPGDTMRFPFIFKSCNPGIFSETWELLTQPVLCGGAALRISLRGTAVEEDVYANVRKEIEEDLAHRQAVEAAYRILEEILDGVRTPERARSPVDAYITEEEIFSRKNEGLYFHDEVINELKVLYSELEPDEEWDLSLSQLQQRIMVVEEDEQREELLQKLNLSMVTMSFPPMNPVKQAMYNATYQLLSEMVDNMVNQSGMIRSVLGLPERDMVENVVQEEDKKGKKTTTEPVKPDSKKSDRKDKKGGKADHERPVSTRSKLSAKKAGRGTTTPTSQPAKSTSDAERPVTPASIEEPGIEQVDPVLEVKYKEKLFAQAYSLVLDTFSKLDVILDDIRAHDVTNSMEFQRS